MKILVISNLYPNKKNPTMAQFHKQQFKELSKLCELKVVAPIPLFKHSLEEVPYKEVTDNLEVFHPRYLVIPKIMRSLYWLFFFIGILKSVKNIHKTFKFDLIFTLWAYPDGVGGYLVSKMLGKPHVVAVLGSDINTYGRYFLRRKIMAYALSRSERVISVSEDLKNKMILMGVAKEKITVVPNGVNIDLYKIMDKISCRKTLGLPLDKKIVLYVGNLERVKGVDLLVEAFARLPAGMLLVLVGGGSLEDKLRAKAREFGIESNVIFAGRITHDAIPYYMNAADLFCLPSRNEGCPNVLLEALACGVPIVASRTGGIPEIIINKELGVLVSPDNAYELKQGIEKAFNESWDREILRQSVLDRSWERNAEKLFSILSTKKSKLNILYHHRTQGRGVEGVHIRGVVKGFRELGHNVRIVSPPGVDPEKTAGKNLYAKKRSKLNKVLNWVSRSLPQSLFEALELFYNFRAHCKILGLIKRNSINFIYERHSFFSFAAVRLAKKFNIPVIIEVNELAGEKRVRKQCFVKLAKKIEKYVFDKADIIVVVSRFLKEKIKEYGINEDKIIVMPNAVDPELFSPEFVDAQIIKKYHKNGAVKIGFIGSFVDWHNIELLVDMFERISKERDALLFLVGDGILKGKIQGIVSDKKIEDKVVFTGSVPHEDIPTYISLMDICVIPQSNEYRSPVKMFEYMAMGKAVVAPRLKPIEDVITDNVNGVLFEVGDENSLKRCLLDLIDDSHKRGKIGREARNTVLSKHLWSHNVEKVLKIYEEVVTT